MIRPYSDQGESATPTRSRRKAELLLVAIAILVPLVTISGFLMDSREQLGQPFRANGIALEENARFKDVYSLLDRIAPDIEETELRLSQSTRSLDGSVSEEDPELYYILYGRERFLDMRERVLGLEGVECVELENEQLDCSWNGIDIDLAGQDDQGIGDKAFIYLTDVRDSSK